MEKKPLILCVDDDRAHLLLFQQWLSSDFEILTADDANKALVLIDRNMPDLILSDIMMPDMDGFQFAGEIKRRHPDAKVPIIFISARRGEEDIMHGLGLGAFDYIVKPISFPILKCKIINVLAGLQEKQSNILQGTLDKIDINTLLRQCSDKSLNGCLEISSGGKNGVIHFKQGEILNVECSGVNEDEAIDHILSWTTGSFQVRQAALDLEMPVRTAPVMAEMKTPRSESVGKMPGLLYQFKVDKFDFQIQTECVDNKVSSIVLRDGKLVKKYEFAVDVEATHEVINQQMQAHHNKVVGMVREKLGKASASPTRKDTPPDVRSTAPLPRESRPLHKPEDRPPKESRPAPEESAVQFDLGEPAIAPSAAVLPRPPERPVKVPGRITQGEKVDAALRDFLQAHNGVLAAAVITPDRAYAATLSSLDVAVRSFNDLFNKAMAGIDASVHLLTGDEPEELLIGADKGSVVILSCEKVDCHVLIGVSPLVSPGISGHLARSLLAKLTDTKLIH